MLPESEMNKNRRSTPQQLRERRIKVEAYSSWGADSVLHVTGSDELSNPLKDVSVSIKSIALETVSFFPRNIPSVIIRDTKITATLSLFARLWAEG